MKNVMMVLFMVSAFTTLSAQVTIDSTGGTRSYTEVVSVDSTSKSELYVRANKWFAKNYGSSKEVIQMNNAEDGSIIGKGITEITTSIWTYLGASPFSQKIHYTITIATKDNKYKCEINNFTSVHPTVGVIPIIFDIAGQKKEIVKVKLMTNKAKKEHVKMLEDIVDAIDKDVRDLFASFKTSMTVKKSTW